MHYTDGERSLDRTAADHAFGDPVRVAASAEEKLHTSSYSELKRISCDYYKGIVTLRGYVPTYRLKQIAQVIVSKVDGVEVIVNRTEVVDPQKPSTARF